ncbi:MAG: 4Fe-4S binding protein [Planctomycetota bacterium]
MISIHVIFALHLTHWLTSGTTISPVEPSEAMYTIELGRINAGAIFFAVAMLSTLVFGRFFCGWACHLVALQDLCAWLLKKIGIRPRIFRLRAMVLAPFAIGFYMFLWPTLKRLVLIPALDGVFPQLANWLASNVSAFPATGFELELVKSDFWATFPGPWVAAVTFIVCGFIVVYLLGAKGFCNYGCPYGAFFWQLDALSPGRIIANLDSCHGCGHCTATCTSNVKVHQEIQVYKQVVDRNCMKCLDCVSVCPNGALRFGFGVPTAMKAPLKGRELPRRKYEVSLRAELALWCSGIGVFFAMRGAYGQVPLLFSMGIAACAVFLFWKCGTLWTERTVSMHRRLLKSHGKLTLAGYSFALITFLITGFVVHTGYVKTMFTLASAHDEEVAMPMQTALDPKSDRSNTAERQHADTAIRYYERALSAGLFADVRIRPRLAWLTLVRGDFAAAERWLLDALAAHGSRDRWLVDLSRVQRAAGALERSEALLVETRRSHPEFVEVLDELFARYVTSNRIAEAEQLYLEHLRVVPKDAGRRAQLAGAIYLPAGRIPPALEQLRTAYNDDPRHPAVLDGYTAVLVISGDVPGAIRVLEYWAATALHAVEPAARLAQLFDELGETAKAEHWNGVATERSRLAATTPAANSAPLRRLEY